MVPLTFEKYLVPPLTPSEIKPVSDLSLPDELIEAMRSVLPRIEAFEAAYKADVTKGASELFTDIFDPSTGHEHKRVFIPTPQVSWTDSLALTSSTVQAIHPIFGTQFDQMIARGWNAFTHTTVPGLCSGWCGHKSWTGHDDGRVATINLQTDGTVNDAVYLMHETGHYVSLAVRGDHPLENFSPSSKVVAETQAFFFQFALYDEGFGPAPQLQMREALDQHRRAEIISSLSTTKILIGYLDNYRSGANPADSEKGAKDRDAAEKAHWHPHGYGALLGAALYGRYKAMDAWEKEKLLKVMYPPYERFPENEGAPTIGAILEAVDVETASELGAFFHEGANLALSASVYKPSATVVTVPKQGQIRPATLG